MAPEKIKPSRTHSANLPVRLKDVRHPQRRRTPRVLRDSRRRVARSPCRRRRHAPRVRAIAEKLRIRVALAMRRAVRGGRGGRRGGPRRRRARGLRVGGGASGQRNG